MAQESLEDVFRNMHTAPLLFIGSGFTKRYCGTMSWPDLMDALARKIRPDSPFPLPSYQHEFGEGLKDHDLFPLIASQMERDFNRLFFGENKFADDSLDKSKIEQGISPFRVYLSQLFSKAKKQKLSSDLQEELSDLKIASKHSINGIITTNYDNFLEYIFPSYDVYVGQEDLIFSQATGYLEIYKIHGCCSNPSSLVFTKENYEDFDRRKSYLTAKLLSFFMEHPILFLGYSAKDANIRGIFESMSECLNEKHLNLLAQRMIFVEYEAGKKDASVGAHSFGFGDKQIVLTKITTESYQSIFKLLIKVKRNYNLSLLKKIRQDLYETIRTNSPKDAIQVISSNLLDGDGNIRDEKIMGFAKEIPAGHNVLDSETIYRHIITGNEVIEINSCMESWFPKKITTFEYPLFYYANEYLRSHKNLPTCVMDYIREHAEFSSFLSNKLLKQKETRMYGTLEEFETNWDDIRNRYQKIILLDRSELENGKLRNFLVRLLEKEPDCLKSSAQYVTDLKRVIRMCDYLENGRAVLQKLENGAKV